MNPPDPSRDEPASWRFQRSGELHPGPTPAPAGFPAPPLSGTNRPRRRTGLPEAKPRQQIRSPGAAAVVAAAASSWQGRGNLHSVSLSPGLAIKDGGGRGEGGNQLFRPRSQRGGEKVKGKNLRKV